MKQNNSFSQNTIHFMKLKWLYFAISLIIVLPGLFSLVRYGLKLSIDFTGGGLIEIQSKNKLDSQKIKQIASDQKIEIVSQTESDNNTYLIRTKPITQEQNQAFKSQLQNSGEGIIEKRFESVGPVIGAELTQKAFMAVLIAVVFIVCYIAWSFRSIPKPYASWKFGASAVVALLHDVLVILGIFSIFGQIYSVEIDSLFITAVLTVMGFSVHDTIVVFDRVRENLPKMTKNTFEEVVDFSLTETIVRSLNTSLTVTLTLTSLILFGGESTHWFVMALLIGIISGTYSSIFNAAPILVLWENKNK